MHGSIGNEKDQTAMADVEIRLASICRNGPSLVVVSDGYPGPAGVEGGWSGPISHIRNSYGINI